MHYRPRIIKAKVQTPKFEIDYRIIDLLELQSKKWNRSKNNIFEWAIITTCKSPKLKFHFKSKKRKKYLVREETLALLDKTANELGISKNELVNKALKSYLCNFL